jgi:hypothetical protein
MSNEATHSVASLALRREALVAQCALQRMMVAAEVRALAQPIAPSNWRHVFGRNLKIPLTIAGVVVGLAVTRPGRVLPLLQTGAALWGVVRKVLALLRPDSGE